MVQISATLVKELRDETNLGMMECKHALVEAQGDKAQAIKLLRERGMAIAGKKASRTANEGLVAALVNQGGKLGVMIEVNCETDFVAKNETFQKFVATLAEKAKGVGEGELAEAVRDQIAAKIAEIGENLVVRRNIRYQVQGPGIIASYIHLGSKIGVLLEVGCQKDGTTQSEAFRELVKDITHHIAASQPQFLSRGDVPAKVVAGEREIYAKQVEGKPAQIMDKIVSGKLEKFYSLVCLLEQGFVKDPDQSVADFLKARGTELGETLGVRRFVRYQVGESL